MQNVPDGLDRKSTRDVAKKRSQHNKLHNFAVLFTQKFQYIYTEARGLKPNLQINRWPLNLFEHNPGHFLLRLNKKKWEKEEKENHAGA